MYRIPRDHLSKLHPIPERLRENNAKRRLQAQKYWAATIPVSEEHGPIQAHLRRVGHFTLTDRAEQEEEALMGLDSLSGGGAKRRAGCVRPWMVKGSVAAKRHMAHLRSLRKIKFTHN